MTAPETPSSIAALVQSFPIPTQVLVIASLEESRRASGRFGPNDVSILMDHLALPRVHVSNALAALERLGFVSRVPGRGPVWRIAPRGRDAISQVVTPRESLQLSRAIGQEWGSLLGGQVHSLLPHWLAPADIAEAVRLFVADHPLELNVFAMTRIPREGGDPELRSALEAANRAAQERGFRLLVATERNLVDDLWGNVIAHAWASSVGIAIFEDRAERGVNYNLTIEVGAMLMTGRRCALLKDTTVRAMPSDLVGHIYHPVDLQRPETVSAVVSGWLDDLVHVRRRQT